MRILARMISVFMCFFIFLKAGNAGTCTPACVHGQCNDSNVCVCTGGWGGVACDDCSQYYYGANCNYLCQMCDIHGTCTPGVSGSCECDAGWSGTQCSSYYCSPACVHGVCSGANTCTCNNGWEGPLCDQAVCSPACQHGDCFAPNMCDCDEGWSGSICEVCDSTHFGEECQNLCSECDVHGTCHSGLVGSCSCDTGWQGILCDTPVCATPCSEFASCIAPGWCECNDGYTGDGYDCSLITQCTGKYDWTPCELESMTDTYCFGENCEQALPGDSCWNSLSIDIGENSPFNFEAMHPYLSAPEVCAGKNMFATDVFFSISLPGSAWYQFSATPREGLDIGLVLWSECTVDADKCINGVDSASYGQAETLELQAGDASSAIIQIILISDTKESRDEDFDVILSVDEFIPVDGDVDMEEENDSCEYEILYDYEIELPESFEEDGDLDAELEEIIEFESQEEMEYEAVEASGQADADTSEYSNDNAADADKDKSFSQYDKDEETSIEGSGGACNQNAGLSGDLIMSALGLLTLIAVRRRTSFQ